MEGTKINVTEALGLENTKPAAEMCKNCPSAKFVIDVIKDEIMDCLSNFFSDVEHGARLIRIYDNYLRNHVKDTMFKALNEYESLETTEFQQIENNAITYLQQEGRSDVADVIKKHETESLADKKKRLKDAVFLSLARWNEWSLIEELCKTHTL